MIDSSTRQGGEKRHHDCFAIKQNLLNKQKFQVKLRTCADVYDQWRAYKRLYRKAPRDGIEFQIEYIDTGAGLDEATRSGAPIALALHGAPGSYHDFALLIDHLARQNVRVIAPNFPDYVATVKTKVLFRHSADEKAAYLRDFLLAINITKIDLLVSHSSAIFPTLLILLNGNRISEHSSIWQEADLRAGGEKGCPDRIANEMRNLSIKGRAPDQDNGKQQLDGSDGEAEEEAEIYFDAMDEIDGNNNTESATATTTATTTTTTTTSNDINSKSTRIRIRKLRFLPKSFKSRSGDVVVKFPQPIEIKAVALLNPAGHRLPKSMKPTWFKCGSVHVYQQKFGRSLFRKFGPAFLTIVGVPVRVDNMDNVMLSATVMRNSKCHRVVEQLAQLSRLKIPTLLVFSENDKLIEKEIFYEMTQFMQLDERKFDVFNDSGNIELSQSRMDDWIRVMVFKAGGHYAYSNYAKTVNKAVSELLKKVQ